MASFGGFGFGEIDFKCFSARTTVGYRPVPGCLTIKHRRANSFPLLLSCCRRLFGRLWRSCQCASVWRYRYSSPPTPACCGLPLLQCLVFVCCALSCSTTAVALPAQAQASHLAHQQRHQRQHRRLEHPPRVRALARQPQHLPLALALPPVLQRLPHPPLAQHLPALRRLEGLASAVPALLQLAD